MGGIHVYFNSVCSKIIERMGRGDLSKVCQKAVLDWDMNSDNIVILENLEEELVKEKKDIDDKIKQIDDKLELIDSARNKEFEAKMEFEEAITKDKNGIKRRFMETAIIVKRLSIEEAEDLFTTYWDLRLKGEEPNTEQFIGKFLFKKQESTD